MLRSLMETCHHQRRNVPISHLRLDSQQGFRAGIPAQPQQYVTSHASCLSKTVASQYLIPTCTNTASCFAVFNRIILLLGHSPNNGNMGGL